MATGQTTNPASTIGALAAGKLLEKATGGRLWPTVLILAGIVLLRRMAATHAARKARTHAPLAAPE